MTDAPTRRAIVTGLTVAGAGGLDILAFVRPVSATVTGAAVLSADADLIRLVALTIEADERRRAFDEEAGEAFDRIESVPIPEALEHQRDVDFPYICFDENRCAKYRLSIDHPWRSIYESPAALSDWAQRWLRGETASLNPRFFTEAHHERMRAVAGAFQQWDRDRDGAEAAAGYTAPAAASKRETRIIHDLLRQIVLRPVHTPEGLAAKVRAATIAGTFYPSDINELPDMLEGPKPDFDKAFLTSICFDAARIGDGIANDISPA